MNAKDRARIFAELDDVFAHQHHRVISTLLRSDERRRRARRKADEGPLIMADKTLASEGDKIDVTSK